MYRLIANEQTLFFLFWFALFFLFWFALFFLALLVVLKIHQNILTRLVDSVKPVDELQETKTKIAKELLKDLERAKKESQD